LFWFGLLYFIIGSRITTRVWKNAILRAAYSSEYAFCLLFYASKINAYDLADSIEYEWKQLTNKSDDLKKGQAVQSTAIRINEKYSFTAEGIRESRGSANFVAQNDRLQLMAKLGCAGILLIITALILCLTWNWSYGLVIAVVGVATVIFVSAKQKALLTQRAKREDNWVDVTKIQWCKNCIHFRNVRGWEDEGWRLQTISTETRLPCQIVDWTTEVWQSYAALETGKRALYPKGCPYLKMKA
jgi:hypothetical protein